MDNSQQAPVTALDGNLDQYLTIGFGLTALLYLALATRVSRAAVGPSNRAISGFLFLIGLMVAGSAFSHNTANANLYGIGRTLAVFSSSFLPLMFYIIYREFTIGRPSVTVLVTLSIVPVMSVLLAMTNPLHHMIWTIVEANGVVRFTNANEHLWFNRVQAPFSYGLLAYSVIALSSWLPTIARAHRKNVILLLVCAVMPFAVSIGNTLLDLGPPAFPFTSLTLALLLPLYGWASLGLRVFEFSPLVYQTMFNHVRDPIFVLDRSQRIISANEPAQELLKSPERDLIGRLLREDLPGAQVIIDRAKDGDMKQTIRMESDRFFELNAAPLNGPSGQDQGIVVVCRDVTVRKQALRALADSEQLIRSLVEHSSNGILRFTPIGGHNAGNYRCTFANQSAEQFLQCSAGGLVGSTLDELALLQPQELLQRFDTDSSTVNSISYETEIDDDQGGVWLRIVAEPVGRDFSVTLIDITQRKHDESRILADALRDPLTGVLNRRGLEKAAAECFAENQRGAVVYLDLNHFKSVNDRFGHQAGDAILKAFGHRLEFCLRPEDILARLGGDEFAIVLPGVTVENAKHIVERLVETAGQAYIIQGQEIECTASVGIALIPNHGKELWELVSIADRAMYNVKSICREEAANDRPAYVAAAVAV